MSADTAVSGALASPEDPTCTYRRSTAEAIEHQLPATIGRYRIIRLLGEGGMGIVYEAEQDHPRRHVALKILKSGLPSPDLLWRFEHEAEILGRLQHPGIAQIYEAGTADTGWGPQPYFAMELIRGAPLLDYVAAHQLNTGQRLELMAKICEGVHHAHQVGIIHRDLKPGNILVEGSGQPKILDFGVARVTDSDVQTTRQTDVGQLVGTLAYMSPEQVLGDPLGIDIRSDVYALGVILFELLAGRLPYQISRQLPEAVHTIREEDPARLSSVSRTYRGDLDTIVGKALEKDKARRYASAAEFAADIRRYLRYEPITARPPSTTYQLRKFARRNRALVTGVVAVFLVLVAGIIVSTWEAAQARRAEATASAVNDFLQNDLLSQASANNQARPDTKPDPNLKVRTALDRAAERINGKFQKQPLVEASIRQTMAITYKDLGLYPEAQRQLERALDLRKRILGEENPDTLISMNGVAELYHYQGKYSQAEPLYTKVLEARQRVLGEEHPETLESMTNLAILYRDQGKYPEAELLFIKVVENEARVLGEEHPSTLICMGALALLYENEGKYAQAEPLFSRVVQIETRVLGNDHPSTLISMSDLALVYENEGKYAQAEPLYTTVVQTETRVLGEEHPHTLTSMNNLALLYDYEGKYAQAEPLYTKVVEIETRMLTEEHRNTLISMNNLALLYAHEGKYAQAEPLYTKTFEIRRRVLGEEHPDTLQSMHNLAALYRSQGKYSQAEPLCNKALDARRRVLGEEHPDTLTSMRSLALLYRDQGQYEKAEPLFTKVVETENRVLGPAHPTRLRHMNDMAALYVNAGKYAQAEGVLRQALSLHQTAKAPSWDQYYCQGLLGASLAGEKKYDGAESLLLAGYKGMRERVDTINAYNRPQLEQAGKWIVQLYERWGKPDKAAELGQTLRELIRHSTKVSRIRALSNALGLLLRLIVTQVLTKPFLLLFQIISVSQPELTSATHANSQPESQLRKSDL